MNLVYNDDEIAMIASNKKYYKNLIIPIFLVGKLGTERMYF